MTRPIDPRHAIAAVPAEHGITGLHHLTAATTDIGRAQAWYTGLLGLRLIGRSVDPTDRYTPHLLLATGSDGAPGSLVTLVEWPDRKRGSPGIGATHHLAFATADRDTLLRWKRWLTDHGQPVDGPYDRTYFTSIYTSDPDGLIVEIATNGPGWTVDEAPDALGLEVHPPPFATTAAGRDEPAIRAETWPEPVDAIDDAMRLERIHHVTAIGASQAEMERLWSEVLGLRLVKRTINFDDPESPHLYWGVGDGAPGTIVTFFVWPAGRKPGRSGAGVTHHFALAVPDGSLDFWADRLEAETIQTTGILDSGAFRRLQFRTRDGMITELATAGPGYGAGTVSPDATGTPLWLPPRQEAHRDRIAAEFARVTVPDVTALAREAWS